MADIPSNKMGRLLLFMLGAVTGSVITALFLSHIDLTAEGIAALITALALAYTWYADRKRRREAAQERLDRAAYLAIGFHRELCRIYTDAKNLGALLWRVRREPRNALSICAQFLTNIKIPVLISMCDRLDPYDSKTAAALMGIVTDVMRARPPDGLTPDNLRFMDDVTVRTMTRGMLRDAQILKSLSEILCVSRLRISIGEGESLAEL